MIWRLKRPWRSCTCDNDVVSDTSQGPGWWIASDGKWYPPEQHPDVRNQVPPAANVGAPSPFQPAQQYQAPAGQPVGGPAPPAGQSYPGSVAQPYWGPAAQPAGGPQQQGAQQRQWGESWGSGAGSTRGVRRSTSVPLPAFVKKQPKIAGVVVLVVVVAIILIVVLSGGSSTASPTAVANTAVADIAAGNFSAVCSLELPVAQPTCRANEAFTALAKITSHNLAVGRVVEVGTEALATVTGKLCVSLTFAGKSVSTCQSNTDPNKALDRGQSFATAYANASRPGGGVTTFVLPLIEVGPKWYVNAQVTTTTT